VQTSLAFVLLVGALSQASGSDPAEEYHVKGGFLLNFVKFVEWPAEAFKSPADPIAICVLGANPFGPGLAQAAQGTVVDNRTVAVRQVADAQQARGCQIVFVSVSERKRMRAVIEATKGASALTVGESDGFIAAGGVIEFRVEESKVKMEISAEAAKRAGLHISSKLLSLSQAGKQ
jgi:hypothetical protein